MGRRERERLEERGGRKKEDERDQVNMQQEVEKSKHVKRKWYHPSMMAVKNHEKKTQNIQKIMRVRSLVHPTNLRIIIKK